MISLTINGDKINVENGTTILEAAKSIGIDIPTLCHDKRLKPHGACRLCVVEVKGARSLVASCTTPANDGMEIQTHSEEVLETRKDILNLLWANHDNDCLTCGQAGACKLQDYCYEHDIESKGGIFKKSLSGEIDSSNQFFTFNRDKCILCGKCVRVCDELQGTGAITFSQRGYETRISHPFEAGMEYSDCVSCGNCVSVCPTGALSEKSKTKFRSWDIDKKVKTTCGYCGVGCQINLVVKMIRSYALISRRWFNDGLMCVKGKFAFNFINHPDRLKTPLIRKNGDLVEASWDEAYDLIVSKANEIKKSSGPDAFAAMSSARCTTEDNYLIQKWFRAVIGTNTVDHCARL